MLKFGGRAFPVEGPANAKAQRPVYAWCLQNSKEGGVAGAEGVRARAPEAEEWGQVM